MKKQILMAAACAIAAAGHAEIAFDNMGPDNQFISSNGKTVAGAHSIADFNSSGFQFISKTTGEISCITAGAGSVVGTPTITFTVYQDASGQLGSALGSVTYDHLAAFGNTAAISACPLTTIDLTAGEKYWLAATTADDAWNAWNICSARTMGLGCLMLGSSAPQYGSFQQAAFRVETQIPAVPEPMSLAVIPALAALIRRRKACSSKSV